MGVQSCATGNASGTMPAMSAAIRELIPWATVERALMPRRK